MPFKKNTRKYHMKVTNERCQWESYSEEKGFDECGKKAKHDHHIKGEGKLIHEGKEDPEFSPGLPLCENHHVRNLKGDIYDANSSFHPDVGQAYKDYRGWKQKAEHMSSITGKRINYKNSPFGDVGREHREKNKRGERYISGDEGSDAHYERKMKQKQWEAKRDRGISPPRRKGHPRFKKKSWIEELLGISNEWK